MKKEPAIHIKIKGGAACNVFYGFKTKLKFAKNKGEATCLRCKKAVEK